MKAALAILLCFSLGVLATTSAVAARRKVPAGVNCDTVRGMSQAERDGWIKYLGLTAEQVAHIKARCGL